MVILVNDDNITEKSSEKFWENLAARYWYFLIIIGIIVIGATIGFILTFNWYVATSAIGGFGTWTFDQFSLATAILWCLYLCLWTLLFVVLPTLAVFGLLIEIMWFAVLPDDVKANIKSEMRRPRPRKRESGSGGFGFLLFVGLCIFVFIDGNWWTPFGSLSLGYFAGAWITVFMWVFILFGIPAGIIGILWIIYRHRQPAEE